MREKFFDIHDEFQQQSFGEKLAKSVDDKACVIFLQGDLGAGKTTLVRGFLGAKGVTEKIKSPTYSLIEVYELSGVAVIHLDLYRLKNPHEIEALSIRDYLSSEANTILLIEWPENAEQKLPPVDLRCAIKFTKTGRQIKLTANTPRGEEVLQNMGEII